mgnify:CR=1 FL=1
MSLLRRHAVRLGAAIRFFTRIPLPGAGTMLSDEEFGKSLAWAPLTGLLIGLWTAGLDFCFRFVLPPAPAAVLTLLAYAAITGGLHLDGLGDTFDGLLSGRSRERMLAIMKDSRVGSFGMLAVVFLLMLDAACLSAFPPDRRFAALCLWPVLGRLASVAGAALYPYARPEGGMGKSFVDHCGMPEFIAGLGLAFACAWFLLGTGGLVWTGIAALLVLLALWRLTRPLGGVTGDILGAACELTQAMALVVWILLANWT